MLAIKSEYDAYCIDDCVLTWGLYVMSELNSVGQKEDRKERANREARQRRLDDLLGGEDGKQPVKRYSNPVATK